MGHWVHNRKRGLSREGKRADYETEMKHELKDLNTFSISIFFRDKIPDSRSQGGPGAQKVTRDGGVGVGTEVTHQLVEGECLFSSVLVQGLYQLICSAALPQNLSGSVTEAAKWVLYSLPLPEDSALQPRAPRPPRGPGATKALRAAPAPRAAEDPGKGPPSPPAPVTLRYCSQDGFIAAGHPRSPRVLVRRQLWLLQLPGAPAKPVGGGGKFRSEPGAQKFGSHTRVTGKNRPGAAEEATG
ncbi:hypothetical protein P7K49_019986 [Saguinus oedipus]|uniref:Uncharacterized protein n=1 Tax=Saguinus oedipus TaxID=9490 RepID=A0ABQ9UYY4_SAGOE|nr:hypothetical protein P7K49_019986 [Saguinus oedipus]